MCIISSGSRQICAILSAGELFLLFGASSRVRMRGCDSAGDLNRVVAVPSSVGSGVGRGPAFGKPLYWLNRCWAKTAFISCKRRSCLRRVCLDLLVIHVHFF